MGNQLFQYAFILAAKKNLNTGFYIDQCIEHDIVDNYFNIVAGSSRGIIPQLFKINGFKNIFSFHLRRLYYKYLAQINKLSVKAYGFNDAVAATILTNQTLYVGFFQSELFFKGAEDLVKERFRLKKAFIVAFKNKYSKLYQDNYIVAVHIRRTDYQNQSHLNLGGKDLSLPLAYYNKALSKYNGQNVHFVFVSDEPDFVNQNFSTITNKTISTDTTIFDFQHLLNADACIISNSTFSWWGAWLNNKPAKVIYAPKYFLGWQIKKQTPAEIYPDSWTLIDF
ncbi:MAG: hypothetical protein JWQ54_1615 [Mucilaginibacter sp.]|nr:hypothetical protein [Mucilaginibacter sp.]